MNPFHVIAISKGKLLRKILRNNSFQPYLSPQTSEDLLYDEVLKIISDHFFEIIILAIFTKQNGVGANVTHTFIFNIRSKYKTERRDARFSNKNTFGSYA